MEYDPLTDSIRIWRRQVVIGFLEWMERPKSVEEISYKEYGRIKSGEIYYGCTPQKT